MVELFTHMTVFILEIYNYSYWWLFLIYKMGGLVMSITLIIFYAFDLMSIKYFGFQKQFFENRQ